MITYSRKPSDVEGAEDKIVKVGHEYEFTPSQVTENMFNMSKKIKELGTQVEYEKAVIVNIEHHHPTILNLPPETMAACKLYLEAKVKLEQANASLVDHETQYAKFLEEIAEIEKQSGVVIKLKGDEAQTGEFVQTSETDSGESAPVTGDEVTNSEAVENGGESAGEAEKA